MSAPEHEWDRLRALAARGAADLEGAHPLEVLRWASEEFGDTLCLSSSMGDAVLAHLASRARPGVPVIFLGHSMGSFMAQQLLYQHGDMLAGCVLCGSNGKPPAMPCVATWITRGVSIDNVVRPCPAPGQV